MVTINKPILKISHIGQAGFVVGLVIGLMYAVILSLFFNYATEISRYVFGLKYGLPLFVEPTWYRDVAFSMIPAVLGFMMAMAIWFGRRQRTSRIHHQMVFWFILLLFVMGEFHRFLWIGYVFNGFEPSLLAFYRYLWIAFVLLAVTFFFVNWNQVRSRFRCQTWEVRSGIGVVVLAFILSITTTVDHRRMDDAYQSTFTSENKVIDAELDRAARTYGIVYDDDTIATLKLWRGKKALEQLRDIQVRFALNEQVGMSDILLQSILMNIGKNGDWSWDHAYPQHILKQYLNFERGSAESDELLMILKHLWRHYQNNGNFAETYLACGIEYEFTSNHIYHLQHNRRFVRLQAFFPYIRDVLMRDGGCVDLGYNPDKELLP